MVDKTRFSLSDLSLERQKRALKKDEHFILEDGWKRFIREQEGFLIFAVDGEWIRSNLSVTFGQGGHGYVHEFIPLNEIWIATHHRDGRRVSDRYFNSTTLHEIAEFREMQKGKTFKEAHEIALQRERGAGILEDPEEDP